MFLQAVVNETPLCPFQLGLKVATDNLITERNAATLRPIVCLMEERIHWKQWIALSISINKSMISLHLSPLSCNQGFYDQLSQLAALCTLIAWWPSSVAILVKRLGQPSKQVGHFVTSNAGINNDIDTNIIFKIIKKRGGGPLVLLIVGSYIIDCRV